jgi:hypothetical protein
MCCLMRPLGMIACQSQVKAPTGDYVTGVPPGECAREREGGERVGGGDRARWGRSKRGGGVNESQS